MRLQTVLIFVFALIAAVSAQLLDCPKCIKAAAKSVTPCSQIEVNIDFFDNQPDKNDGASKLCYCSLASNFGWMDTCKETCPDALRNTITGSLELPKEGICKDVPKESLYVSASSGPLSSWIPKTGAAVAVAIVAVAHILA
ncbi:MAG: hypothetical protein J3Q66DRAFT_335137 [Benniella sp.]|nr:MAG: hypothetical protein J3Q66DRAFT_335137 [Benniella sp.]